MFRRKKKNKMPPQLEDEGTTVDHVRSQRITAQPLGDF